MRLDVERSVDLRELGTERRKRTEISVGTARALTTALTVACFSPNESASDDNSL